MNHLRFHLQHHWKVLFINPREHSCVHLAGLLGLVKIYLGFLVCFFYFLPSFVLLLLIKIPIKVHFLFSLLHSHVFHIFFHSLQFLFLLLLTIKMNIASKFCQLLCRFIQKICQFGCICFSFLLFLTVKILQKKLIYLFLWLWINRVNLLNLWSLLNLLRENFLLMLLKFRLKLHLVWLTLIVLFKILNFL